jgi:hypothetical protein
MKNNYMVKAKAKDILNKWLKPGMTIYTVLRHVSASGMSRNISVHIVDEYGIQGISGLVRDILGYSWDKKSCSLKVKGCGMDMGYDIVNSLSYAMHGMDATTVPEGFRAGYTFLHRWI